MAYEEDDVDFDFDLAWSERTVTAPRIRLMGETYTLPKVMPAKIILLITKETKGKKSTDEVDPQVILSMMEILFGKENVEQIMNSGLGIEQLPEVVERIQRIYMDRAEKAIRKSRGESIPGKSVTGK